MDFEGTFDRTTWQALTAALTVVGLGATVAIWKRRGAVSGLRALAVAMLPVAAYLTGALRMFFEIGEAVVRFAARLTFSPVVWAGVVVLGVAIVLLLAAAVLEHRGVGRHRPRKGGRSEKTGRSRREQRPLVARGRDEAAGDADPEFDDIESLLRKHGIS